MSTRFSLVCLALLLPLLAPLSLRAEQEVLDGVAAVVNGDVITFSQVRDLVGTRERALQEQFKGQELIDKIKELRLSAVQILIDNQLILQEFKKNKFTHAGLRDRRSHPDDHPRTIRRGSGRLRADAGGAGDDAGAVPAGGAGPHHRAGHAAEKRA